MNIRQTGILLKQPCPYFSVKRVLKQTQNGYSSKFYIPLLQWHKWSWVTSSGKVLLQIYLSLHKGFDQIIVILFTKSLTMQVIKYFSTSASTTLDNCWLRCVIILKSGKWQLPLGSRTFTQICNIITVCKDNFSLIPLTLLTKIILITHC